MARSTDTRTVRRRPLVEGPRSFRGLAGFGSRLRAALTLIEDGQCHYLTGPHLDSVPTVRMQLHEDYLRTLGISRGKGARTEPTTAGPAILRTVEENTALHLVDQLRDRGIDAHLYKSPTGARGYGIRIGLRDGREALWDTDGALGLEATVMRDGMLVGMVPTIPGSENFDDAQVLDAIARTDYDQPIATQRKTAPPPAPALRREGGVFRRFLGGFRER